MTLENVHEVECKQTVRDKAVCRAPPVFCVHTYRRMYVYRKELEGKTKHGNSYY